ncbi:hypothetical protein [Pseudofulvimonas gallinarii]|uniref:hypothetical protein n=1 Tax=Pseudofulvimonas gallinarii TaxID=634155 RepID=UPI000F48ACD4|nr:hypothetical protein [Pseudofulvimonas gallinarii]
MPDAGKDARIAWQRFAAPQVFQARQPARDLVAADADVFERLLRFAHEQSALGIGDTPTLHEQLLLQARGLGRIILDKQ